MCLVYPWYNVRQPKTSLIYLKALTRISRVYAETRKLINLYGVRIPDAGGKHLPSPSAVRWHSAADSEKAEETVSAEHSMRMSVQIGHGGPGPARGQVRKLSQ